MRFLKVLIVFFSLSLAACRSEVSSEESPRKVKCKSAVSQSEEFEYSNFPGRVAAATDVNLGFRVAGVISDISVLDGAYVRKGEVVARLDNRDYALQLAATQAEYDGIKAEVDRIVTLFADQSVSANDYDKATNTLRAITAKLSAHKNALADTELRAPIDGYVTKSNFGRGEAVAAGTPVVSIISASAPEITIDIPAANYLKQTDFKGATATIELYKGQTFNLRLKSVSPKANLNQLYKVTFTVESNNGILPSAGMSAMVEMRYSKSGDSSVLIPFSAIVEDDDQCSVWVVSSDGRVESRKVTVTEIKSSGEARIESGLTAGEVVVAAGVNSLKEGQKVMILEEISKSNIGGVK
ncbi:MAG: efflux RND transporter periplasmic adaptor subunit [Rikenellaceae bacterium]